jgi:superfamily II DNA or RNA helicase
MEVVDFDFTDEPSSKFKLRDYQLACIDSVRAGWEKYSRQLIDAATGTGKTSILSAIAAEEWSKGNRTLVLENRDALVWQTAQRITKETGIEADVEKAENIASPSAPIVVASVQTLCRESRLTGFADDHFGLVVTDECHHSLARSYEKVLGYFHYGAESLVDGWEPPSPEVPYPYHARILGVTATPDLGNRRSLGEFYQHIAYQYQLLQAVADGWLVRPVMKNIPLKIDIRGLRPSRTPNGSDFTAAELSERLVPVLEALAEQIATMAFDRKSIAFVPSIECARILAAACCRKGLKGIFVSGECLDVDEKTDDFRKSGPGTILCNAALYVEGADFPDINCVVCARATKSKGFYRQQVGRGTRVLPGVVDGLPTAELRKLAIAQSAKPDLLVLDPLWVSDRIDLCDAYDLYTTKPEVKERLKEQGDPTPEKALEAERDFIKALEKEARKHARKKARTIDPLAHAVALGDVALASWVPETTADMRPPTMGQLDFLRRHGVATENIKHAGFAHKLIGRVLSRIKLGLATPKQLSLMAQLGLSETYCATLTIPQATAAIDAVLKGRREDREIPA